MQFIRQYLSRVLQRHDHAELLRIRGLIEAHTPAETDRLLAEALHHCLSNINYYRRSARSAGDFTTFPVLTRADIRANYEELASPDAAARGAYKSFTSGSTGEPLTVLHDPGYKAWARSAEDYFYREMLGMEPSSAKKVVMWLLLQQKNGRAPAARRRLRLWLTRTTFLNSLLIQDFGVFVRAINRRRPDIVQGYAYVLYFLAKFIQKNNLRVHSPQFIYSSAETMFPHMRALVEEVFKCPVRNFYGSREVGPIAGECSKGRFHVFDFLNYAEILNSDGKPCAPGEEGRVAVTTLRNYSMPLVRYEIGDRAVASAGCDCGSKLPVFEKLAGRITDYFPRRDGSVLDGGYFMSLMHANEWADEFQFLQTHYERIEVQYTTRRAPTEAEKAKVMEGVRLAMGEDCEVVFRELKKISRTRYGKFLHTRTLVDKEYSNAEVDGG